MRLDNLRLPASELGTFDGEGAGVGGVKVRWGPLGLPPLLLRWEGECAATKARGEDVDGDRLSPRPGPGGAEVACDSANATSGISNLSSGCLNHSR